MITLHYHKNDKLSKELKSKLDELSLHYKFVEHDKGTAFIEEDSKLIKTPKEIDHWLFSLEQELKWQRSISGDGCYIDPKSGEIC